MTRLFRYPIDPDLEIAPLREALIPVVGLEAWMALEERLKDNMEAVEHWLATTRNAVGS